MSLLAGCAGGLIITGMLLLIGELTRKAASPGTPPRIRISIGPQLRRRLLAAVAVGIAVLAITRWPVAAVASALAVSILPRITSGKAARRQAAVLEGLEQWTRRLSDMLTASRGLEDALQASGRHAPVAVKPAVTALGARLAARARAEQALRPLPPTSAIRPATG